jgi:uncharacterized membrane protein
MIILDPTLSEWLNLLFRWIHVFAGIMWVGTTYYFTWLDARLTEEEKAALNTGHAAEVWMVHSGGFYVVERRKTPDLVSRTLHWFRWEAAITWLSGFALLVLIYYLGGGVLVDPDVRTVSVGAAVALGIGIIVACGVVYDMMMASPLVRHENLFAAIAYVLIVGVIYLLTNFFSGRAAYIHLGAIFGTIMAANVWMHILPSQRRMIAALKEGRKPDERLSARAKLRSKQNTFMAVPVVFVMISNHFPGVTYGERYNWVILSVLVLVGWIAAKFIRRA